MRLPRPKEQSQQPHQAQSQPLARSSSRQLPELQNYNFATTTLAPATASQIFCPATGKFTNPNSKTRKDNLQTSISALLLCPPSYSFSPLLLQIELVIIFCTKWLELLPFYSLS